jgi:hypothetical protein
VGDVAADTEPVEVRIRLRSNGGQDVLDALDRRVEQVGPTPLQRKRGDVQGRLRHRARLRHVLQQAQGNPRHVDRLVDAAERDAQRDYVPRGDDPPMLGGLRAALRVQLGVDGKGLLVCAGLLEHEGQVAAGGLQVVCPVGGRGRQRGQEPHSVLGVRSRSVQISGPPVSFGRVPRRAGGVHPPAEAPAATRSAAAASARGYRSPVAFATVAARTTTHPNA